MTKLMYRKTYRAGDYVEIYDYEKPVGYGYQCDREVVARDPVKKRRDNIDRAKKQIVRLALANSQDTDSIFLTLTYADNVVDREKVIKDVRKFIAKLRVKYPSAGYLYTLEYQKRGAMHVHMLVFFVNWIDMEWLDKAWYHGMTNIQATNDNKHRAFYLTKYIGKDIGSADGNKKTYFTSRNLQKPLVDRRFISDRELIGSKQLQWVGGYFSDVFKFVNVRIYYDERKSDN